MPSGGSIALNKMVERGLEIEPEDQSAGGEVLKQELWLQQRRQGKLSTNQIVGRGLCGAGALARVVFVQALC